MCGINGIYGLADEFRSRDLLVHMNTALSHRGPDGQGIFTRGRIALGHRRLSIIDLSENGRQPMLNAAANVVITYNGEIYNYKKIRQDIRNYEFRSGTDTEVILALYEKYGEDFVNHLDGMFALALWDDRDKKLILARDRVGKKPLYYYQSGQQLVFSSEIRGLIASGLFTPTLSQQGLANYLQYQTVYSPNTILEGVQMLEAGTMLVIKEGIFDRRRYWNPDKAKETHTLTGPYDKVVKQTRELFFTAVEKRLISDVPLGAFLSGGVDSSCVVAAMSKISGQTVNTFNIAFSEQGFDESVFAKQIAEKFKTEHNEIALSADDFLHEVPAALKAMDHPSVDGPNSYVVSKYARKSGITVALSGVGGDELFGGYPVFRNIKAMQKYRFMRKLPVPARKWMLKAVSGRFTESQRERLGVIIENPALNWTRVYPVFRSVYSDARMQKMGFRPVSIPAIEGDPANTFQLMSEISVAELKTYLENVLLRDTDQMSMASSLEVRAPFMDKDLMEFVLSLPDDFKPLSPPKKLIIDAMGDLLPEAVWNRNKMGFTFPWKHWINNELKEFCSAELNAAREMRLVPQTLINELLLSLQLPENPQWHLVWNLVVLTHWLRINKIHVA